MNPEDLLTSFAARDWYAVAALTLGGIIYFLRKWETGVWDRIPKGWRWVPPVFLAMATGFTDAFFQGKPWKAALLQAVAAAFWIAGPAMGGHSMLKESVLPYGSRKKEE